MVCTVYGQHPYAHLHACSPPTLLTHTCVHPAHLLSHSSIFICVLPTCTPMSSPTSHSPGPCPHPAHLHTCILAHLPLSPLKYVSCLPPLPHHVHPCVFLPPLQCISHLLHVSHPLFHPSLALCIG